MIKSKTDYLYYYECDLKATGIYKKGFLKRLIDRRYRFYKSLRLTEYFTNCKSDFIGKIIAIILRINHRLLCDKYHWTIPINVFAALLLPPPRPAATGMFF